MMVEKDQQGLIKRIIALGFEIKSINSETGAIIAKKNSYSTSGDTITTNLGTLMTINFGYISRSRRWDMVFYPIKGKIEKNGSTTYYY